MARQYSTQCSTPWAQKALQPLALPNAQPTLAPSTTSCSLRDTLTPAVCEEGSGSDMGGAGELACTVRGHSEATLA